MIKLSDNLKANIYIVSLSLFGLFFYIGFYIGYQVAPTKLVALLLLGLLPIGYKIYFSITPSIYYNTTNLKVVWLFGLISYSIPFDKVISINEGYVTGQGMGSIFSSSKRNFSGDRYLILYKGLNNKIKKIPFFSLKEKDGYVFNDFISKISSQNKNIIIRI